MTNLTPLQRHNLAEYVKRARIIRTTKDAESNKIDPKVRLAQVPEIVQAIDENRPTGIEDAMNFLKKLAKDLTLANTKMKVL